MSRSCDTILHMDTLNTLKNPELNADSLPTSWPLCARPDRVCESYPKSRAGVRHSKSSNQSAIPKRL